MQRNGSLVAIYPFSRGRMQAAPVEGRFHGAEGGGSVEHSAFQQGWPGAELILILFVV